MLLDSQRIDGCTSTRHHFLAITCLVSPPLLPYPKEDRKIDFPPGYAMGHKDREKGLPRDETECSTSIILEFKTSYGEQSERGVVVEGGPHKTYLVFLTFVSLLY